MKTNNWNYISWYCRGYNYAPGKGAVASKHAKGCKTVGCLRRRMEAGLAIYWTIECAETLPEGIRKRLERWAPERKS